MKAVYYARFGGAELLKVGDLPAPEPQPGEVLIRVRAAGVNPIDWKLREGHFKAVFPYAFPIIPGWDAAGEVAGVGADVTGFVPGARVMAYCRKPTVQWGCYAEYVTMPAEAVAHTPAGLDDRQAAALPLVGLTAWQALVETARVQPGQSVFINAASGGVGSIAVPLARHLGARVIAVCGPANADYVRQLGAHDVIDYRAADVTAATLALAPEGVDVMLDGVGGEALAAAYPMVRRGGTIVALNNPPDPDACAARDITGVRLFSTPNGAQIARVAALVAEGALPVGDLHFMPLEQAAEAQRLSQAGHVRGKIVLDIG